MKKIICSFISIFIILTNIIVLTPVSATSSTSMPVVVSLGDSFSSGEGIEPYYGQYSDNKYYCEDWIAHRSTLAWGGLIEYNGVSLNSVKATSNSDLDDVLYRTSGVNDGTWYFGAASGALTDNVLSKSNGGEKQPKYVTVNISTNNEYEEDYVTYKYSLDYQIDTITSLPDDVTVDYVTLTIGGNDMGFSKVIKNAIGTGIGFSPNSLKDMLYDEIGDFWKTGGIAEKLEKVYKEILQKAPEATLVVAGYPRLIYMDEETQSTNNWWCSYLAAYLINNTVAIFDSYIEQIVKGLNTDRAIYVDVKDAFSGHESGADDAYINGIMLISDTTENVDKSGVQAKVISDGSMHPNAKGAQAYASVVQEALSKIDSGFGDITYNTTSTLNVYDVNSDLYDDYTVEITGEKFGYLFGILNYELLNEDYFDTFTVSSSHAVSLKLPKGNYTIKVTDNNDASNYFTKEVEIRNSKNTEINIYTDFANYNIPSDALSYNNHHYYLYDLDSINSYEEAAEYCESLGGYLATISSSSENDVLYNYVVEKGYLNAYFGYTDSTTEGEWTWINGEDNLYTNWASKEPNSENALEDYAMFYFGYLDGKWNDGDFGAGGTVRGDGPFICEWDR